jgi:uncharacterized protein
MSRRVDVVKPAKRSWVPRGTLLNTATVAVGALIGLLIGKSLPHAYQDVAMSGLGLVTLGIGIKLFLGTKNILIIAVAVAVGGMLGLALGIHSGIESFAEWAKQTLGGQDNDRFTEGLIASSVLFCIGPMTLLGCIQDGLEGKIELLALKSTMDGIGAVFFAAATGNGILVTALVVLVVQGALTLMAGVLRPLADDEDMIGELSATGGIILMATGFGLLKIKELHTADYLPALVLAPLLVVVFRRFTSRGSVNGK